MKLMRLCKIEFYRFFRSMEIVKYFVIIPIVLALMSYLNIFSVRNDILADGIWGSMSSIYLYIMITSIVLIAIYVGREYQYKTINYEVIRDYKIYRIAAAKTVTCGLLAPLTYSICIMIYLSLLIDILAQQGIARIGLMYIVHVHICTATILYVMICKSGIYGGIVAFVRFFVVEAILQTILGDNKTVMGSFLLSLQVFEQWNKLICIEIPLKMGYIWLILITTIVEYGMLLFILRWTTKQYDFS